MKLLALAGPTACGKTLLALELAERLNGEIISVDSGAVYRDMNIGTATPSEEMCARVRHHLVNIVPPTELYHVGRFVTDVQAAAADIRARQKTPILVGGTMMYFHILQNGLSPIPPVPEAVSAQVSAELQDKPAAAAHALLAAVDKAAAARLAKTDRQRVHRALSVYRATGKPLSAWQQEETKPPVTLQLVRLMPDDKKAHRQRIGARLKEMWASGLEEETRFLLEHWQLSPESTPLRIIGYRQAAARIRNEINSEKMHVDAYTATCQLAKRQMTWLRRWTAAVALTPPESHTEREIQAFLEKCGDWE